MQLLVEMMTSVLELRVLAAFVVMQLLTSMIIFVYATPTAAVTCLALMPIILNLELVRKRFDITQVCILMKLGS